MAIAEKKKVDTAHQKPANKLNDAVAKVYDTRLSGFQNQLYVYPKTGTKFSLEKVTIAQVEAMVKAGSKDFVKKEFTTAVPEKKSA